MHYQPGDYVRIKETGSHKFCGQCGHVLLIQTVGSASSSVNQIVWLTSDAWAANGFDVWASPEQLEPATPAATE